MPNETRAGLRLGALFTDHLVLQQERPCRLWGSDEPGRHVSVQLRVAETRAELATARVQAAADGRFQVELPALAAGGPYELSVEGSQHITLRDVWVGEVWLASGQSNMEWKVASSKDAELEIEAPGWVLSFLLFIPTNRISSPSGIREAPSPDRKSDRSFHR